MIWATNETWSNGGVMLEGASADGMNAMGSLKDKPSWVHGAFLIWATGDGYMTTYPGGAFRQALVRGWMKTVQHDWLTPVKELMGHEDPSDEFWDRLVATVDDYKWIDFPLVSW